MSWTDSLIPIGHKLRFVQHTSGIVGTIKLWNKKTTFKQYLSIYDVVIKQIVLPTTY